MQSQQGGPGGAARTRAPALGEVTRMRGSEDGHIDAQHVGDDVVEIADQRLHDSIKVFAPRAAELRETGKGVGEVLLMVGDECRSRAKKREAGVENTYAAGVHD